MIRNYDAAKTSDLFHGWGNGNATADALLWSQLSKIRSRSRDLGRNNHWVRKFFKMVQRNVIGSSGIIFQSKVMDPNGKPDTMANQLIESAWAKWCKSCDVTDSLSFKQFCTLAVGAVAQDGEVLIRIVEGYPNEFGFALQLIEADHLPEHFHDFKRNIRMGIEYDEWGKAQAYHLYENHPGDVHAAVSQKIIRVPADQIIHLYVKDRVSQGRGVPWMHAAMTNLKMLGGYEEAELVAARLGAAKSGFYTKPAGEDYESSETDEYGDPVQEVTPGMIETLPDGWGFQSFDPTHPTSAFKDFAKAILRGIASGFDVSYNYLSNDLEGVNYSSIRAGVLDERDAWMVLQSWFIERLNDRIYERWLKMALLTQQIPLPYSKIKKFNAPKWMPRRWSWVDPQKDMTSNILAMKAGFKSPSMIAAEMGYDIEEVYMSIKRDQELRKKIGITTASDAELLQLLSEINQQGEDDA